jgi:hypothetical protein
MADLSPESPLSLQEAAEICLRGLVKASTLRAAAMRGELVVERLGRRIVVTPAAIDAWREKCRDREKARASTCARSVAISSESLSSPRDGSSSIEEKKSARDALLATARKLKDGSLTTSPKNAPSRAASVHYIKSR